MAESPFKGLLYSPEVLGGIGLLTAGLSGQNPGAALPNLIQGMKTASMFSAMEQEEEKKKLIKEYANKVPEEDKALFKAFPLEYLKKNEFATPKTAKFTTFINEDGDKQTLNISTKDGLAKATELTEKGYDIVSQSIAGKNVSDLSKKSIGKTEETIIGGNELLANLENQKLLFKDEFLDYKGVLKYKLLLKKDKASGFTGVPLTNEERQYVNSYSAWQQTNLQYFNQYRKIITGVAAGEKEIGWLQESIPSEKDTPNTYRAKLDNQIKIQKALIENAEKFRSTKGKIYNENGEYSKEYLNYLKGKVKPNGEYLESRIKAYVIDNGYDEDTIYGILDKEFKGTNWREILQIYLNAKGGKL
tara:strand:- start:18 stop:1097 length:1080 start_codon:yes stop_codon:yes gene_type:complete